MNPLSWSAGLLVQVDGKRGQGKGTQRVQLVLHRTENGAVLPGILSFEDFCRAGGCGMFLMFFFFQVEQSDKQGREPPLG